MKAVLVYQQGIANIFQVERCDPEHRGETKRLSQHAYIPCVWFARGLAAAGWEVQTMHCDSCGDIINKPWRPGVGDLFRENRIEVRTVPAL